MYDSKKHYLHIFLPFASRTFLEIAQKFVRKR